MSDIILWGFDASTYVRTVKMVLAEKGVTQFEQVPLNVLKGEPKTPEHLERHPFGKVPDSNCEPLSDAFVNFSPFEGRGDANDDRPERADTLRSTCTTTGSYAQKRSQALQ